MHHFFSLDFFLSNYSSHCIISFNAVHSIANLHIAFNSYFLTWFMLRYGEIYSALISKARKLHLFIERFVRESKENKTGKTMKG